PAQALRSALQNLSAQRHIQLIFRTDLVGDLRTPGAMGVLTTDEALRQLLSGTGLTYQYLDDNTVTVRPASPYGTGPNAAPHEPLPASQGSDNDSPAGSPTNTDGSLWGRFLLAQAAATDSADRPSAAQSDADIQGQPVQLQEVVVTARKREERLVDVPVPVAVISGDSLAQTQQLSIQDYYVHVPALNITEGVQSQQSITIRGLPTNTVLLDDVPTYLLLDIDPGNLARLEILRGPQGTLYGGGGLGGIVKFVTVDPTTDQLSGRLEAGLDTVSNGYD